MATKGRKVLLKTATPAAPPEPPDDLDETAATNAADEDETDETDDAQNDQDDESAQDTGEDQATDSLPASEPLRASNGVSGKTAGVPQTVTIGQKTPVDVGHPDKQPRLPWTQPHYPGMPRHGIVLGPNDPNYVRGIRRGPVVELTQDVYRAVKPSTSFTYTFSLIANKGGRIDAENCILVTDEDA